MSKTIHLSMDIRGALRNLCFDPESSILGSAVDVRTGRTLTKSELFDELCNMLEAGQKVMPVGQACDGFSYQTGCPGHNVEGEE